MKTLILKLKAVPATLMRDAFFVLLGISVILLLVQLGYYAGLIREYNWH